MISNLLKDGENMEAWEDDEKYGVLLALGLVLLQEPYMMELKLT